MSNGTEIQTMCGPAGLSGVGNQLSLIADSLEYKVREAVGASEDPKVQAAVGQLLVEVYQLKGIGAVLRHLSGERGLIPPRTVELEDFQRANQALREDQFEGLVQNEARMVGRRVPRPAVRTAEQLEEEQLEAIMVDPESD